MIENRGSFSDAWSRPTGRAVESPPEVAPASLQKAYNDCLLEGMWSSPSGQNEAKKLWRSFGPAGVRWLVDRLCIESDAEAVSLAAGLLSSMGRQSLPKILEKLEDGLATGNVPATIAMLTTLTNFRPLDEESDQARVSATLNKCLGHRERRVRRLMCSAASCTRRRSSIAFLNAALASEGDQGLRSLIGNLLRSWTEPVAGCSRGRKFRTG